jgi:hypothetical protein
MRHRFRVGDHVLGHNAATERTEFYDIIAVTGDYVTLTRNYFSKKRGESHLFTISGPHTLETGDPDKTLELMQNLATPEV